MLAVSQSSLLWEGKASLHIVLIMIFIFLDYIIEFVIFLRYDEYAEGVKSEIGDIVFLGLLLSMQVDIGKQINTKNQICLTMSDAWPGSGSFSSDIFYAFQRMKC